MLRGSPVSDGGRGLKQERARALVQEHVGSPVSDGGRGLKLIDVAPVAYQALVRPSAMAGVD